MSLNEKAKILAFNLLNKFGKDAIYKRATGENFNENTNENEVIFESYNIKCYVDNSLQTRGFGDFDESLRNGANSLILIASNSLPFLPSRGDLIETKERIYSVVKNQELYGGDDVALHQIVGALR